MAPEAERRGPGSRQPERRWSPRRALPRWADRASLRGTRVLLGDLRLSRGVPVDTLDQRAAGRGESQQNGMVGNAIRMTRWRWRERHPGNGLEMTRRLPARRPAIVRQAPAPQQPKRGREQA